MRVSVVINTFNRASSLKVTLESLRHQTYSDFEVIVVNGPSTDHTERVLESFPEARVERCDIANISKSRNIGIVAVAGDIVAFIDDDAIPEPLWLEEIVQGYDDEGIGGVGGIVYDNSGYTLQYVRCVTNRRGSPRFDVQPPFYAYEIPHGDWYLHLLGTNATFRRRALEEIGGFDEEFEYFLDETYVCMRMIDQGYWLKLLPNAAVHHKFLASHLRCDSRIYRQPFPIIKNTFYFGLQTIRPDEPFLEAVDGCYKIAESWSNYNNEMRSKGVFNDEEHAAFADSIKRATQVGLDRGLQGVRRTIHVPPAESACFKRYPTTRPDRRLTLCLVSQTIPPDSPGGIGRFTLDQARGFAALGHEVHLITGGSGNTVDFEQGVWVHRIKSDADGDWATPRLGPLTRNLLGRAAAVHREVRRIAQTRKVDLVSVPIWDFEGYFCLLDDELATVLTLQTTLKLMAEIDPRWTNGPEMRERLAFEKATVRAARRIHAISRNILETVHEHYGESERLLAQFVAPLGVVDRRGDYHRRTEDGKIRILFVGRLEHRKGIDVLLNAAVPVLRGYSEVEFHVVGNDDIPSLDGSTPRLAFEQEFAGQPFRDRVVFKGQVSEEELYRCYAECDIFVAPSRYESFGLIFLEAMMFGKPVIGCRAGGMLEVIEEGGNGLLAEPGDVPSLVVSVLRLVQDGDLRERMGRRSRELFEMKFSATTMVEATLSAYGKIVHESALADASLKTDERGQSNRPDRTEKFHDRDERADGPRPSLGPVRSAA